jgi:hypothetical protein
VIQVKADISGALAYLKQLEQRDIPRVVGRTLIRTAASTKTASSRLLRKRINLPKKVIDAAIKTRRGTNEIQNLTALRLGRAWFEIIWSGKPFPLRDFDARETSRGVTYKVSRSQRRKVYVRAGRKGFIIKRFGGHVFVRVGTDPPGKGKAPIKRVFGPSIPQFAVTQRERRAIIEHAQKVWGEELTRNARFALARRAASY